MPVVPHGLNPQHAALWKTQTWTGGRAEPSWRAEERRLAALPLDEMLALDPANLDDWQRCLVAERLVGKGLPADALRFLAPVSESCDWHPAVSYPDVFDALSEAWREAGAPDRRVAVLERGLAYARARHPESARMCSRDLAEALCAAGRVERALGIFAEQVRTKPLDPWPYWFMGTSFTESGNASWAAAALRRGLQVLQAIQDPEGLTDQFNDQLRDAEHAPDGPPLPGELDRLFAMPLPPAPRRAQRAPTPQVAPPSKANPARRQVAKVGRNDPCPCGSGKKYKRCCGA